MSAETVTILRATGGRCAQKAFVAGQAPRSYNAGNQFTFECREVAGLDDFALLLAEVECDPTAFLIRGRPLPHLDIGSTVFRRCRGEDAAFTETRTRLVCVDVDNAEAPEGVSACSDEAVESVVAMLPTEFHNASYVRQFSSSAGRSGQKVKLHLWWWFDRPYADEELRRWAEATEIADPKLYNPVQPHYTALPAFEGIADPFEGLSRIAFVRKNGAPVKLVLPERYSHPKGAPRDGQADVARPIARDENGKAVDGREELLRNIRWQVLHKRHPRTEAEYVEMVWAEFCDRAQTGPTAHSGNNYTLDAVSRGCARDWHKCGAVHSEPLRCIVSADTAAAQMANAIREALGARDCTAIKATPGLGKSVVTAAEIIALPDIEKRYVEIYAPTRKQQLEWAERLKSKAASAGKSPLILTVFGRDADNCPKHEIAAELARNEIPVTPSLCRGKAGGEVVQCEHFETCRYRAQFVDNGPAIRIFSHAHLSAPRPKRVRAPSLIVIDETFTQSLVDVSGPRLVGALKGALSGLRLPMRRARANAEVLAALPDAELTIFQAYKAIQSGAPLLDELRARGVTHESLRSAATVLSARLPLSGLHPGKGDAAFRTEAKSSFRPRFVLAVRALRALAVELETPRRFSHSVKACPDGEAKLCVTKSILRLWDHETIVILDADYEPQSTMGFLPGVRCVSIEAKQNARFVQVEDLSFSKGYLGLRPGGAINSKVVAELARQIRSLPGKSKMVVTYKGLIPTLREQLPSARYTHFGGLRGTNDFEDCETAIIVGRNYPPTDAIEDIARALHYASPEPLMLAEPVPRRHAVGKGFLWSYDFFDERLQSVLRAMREAETRQAIGRLRLVHAKQPKSVYIFSSQPVGIAIDQLMAFHPSKGEKLFEQLGGFLPMNPNDLSRLAGTAEFPRGATQAKNWRDETTKTGDGIKSTLMRRSVLVAQTSYRRRGKLGRSTPIHVSPIAHPYPEISLGKRLASPEERAEDVIVAPLPWTEVTDDRRPEGVPDFIQLEEVVDAETGLRVCRAIVRFAPAAEGAA